MAIEHLWNDMRFALRQFTRRPGLTLAALVALTCGLGGVTTVFTLVNAVILRPLPVVAPDRLVWMRDPSFSFPVFEEVRARGTMLSHVFAWESRTMQAQWKNDAEATHVMLATGGIYDTLGLHPAAGRLLTESDGGRSPADAKAVAVLSYSAWQRHFGASTSAIGQTLRIDGTPFTIVGVTPADFFGVEVGVPVDVTIPLTMLPRIREDERQPFASPSRSWLNIMGRLRPGLALATADAEFQTIWPQILNATSEGVRPSFRPRYLTFTSGLESGVSGYSPVRRQFRDPLLLLFALVGLLLVAACATVANLLLAAAAGRRHELAVRLALGAARRRIMQQLFIEGLMLALAGAGLGLLFSAWTADVLVQLLSTSYASVVVDVAPDQRVLLFVASIVAVATTVFTIAPIVRAWRIDPGQMLDGGARQAGTVHRARAARALVAVQVAISLTLLAGSALFVRDLGQLLARDVGFNRENLLVVSVDALSPLSVPQRRATTEAPDFVPYYGQLLQRFGDTAGVVSASVSFKPPISNERGYWFDKFLVEGGGPIVTGRTYMNAVSPGYFRTMGMPLIAGRDVESTDRDGRPRVVIINTAFARAYFGEGSPIGRHVLMGDEATRLEVIGLVGDTTYQNLHEDRKRIAYVPFMQVPDFLRQHNLVAELRVASSAMVSAESIRAAVRAVDPEAPFTIQSVRTRIDESLVGERLITLIAVFLGVVSLLLGCGALGGLMSHLVTARTREIGLRLALGAERRSVLTLVLRQTLAIAIFGGIGGLGLTWAGGRLVAGFLSTISPLDPWALAAATAILLLTAAIAGYLPARRAAHVDPMVALRAE
jgi:putative ABC transport system permease protein